MIFYWFFWCFLKFWMVEVNGIEPLTLCLQSRCSPSWAIPPKMSWTLVELNGIEPMTSCMPCKRSPNWAITPRSRYSELLNGGGKRDRTVDPLLAKQMLSQLSYTPTLGVLHPLDGGGKRDRTVDPLLAKQMLSQLSYTPTGFYINSWWR